MKVMGKLLCFTVLLALSNSTLGLEDVCGLPKEIGPCRFTEPCKPTLLSWNDTFIIVSWEGLFEGCHENQIDRMWIRSGEGKHFWVHQTTFSKKRAYLERKFCDDSKIAIRIDFMPTFLTAGLNTQYNDCKNIITNDSNEAIVGGLSGGTIIGGIAGGKLPSLSLLIIKAKF